MAEISISINGRSYDIECEQGQEQRVADLAGYINQRSAQISGAGAAKSDAHLLVLTSLILADELFELRENGGATTNTDDVNNMSAVEEKALLDAIRTITDRVDGIASKVDAA